MSSLGLELNDFYGAVHAFSDRIERRTRPITKPDARLISIGARDLTPRRTTRSSSAIQDVDLAIAADGEATLPALIEAVKQLRHADRKSALEARGKKLGDAADRCSPARRDRMRRSAGTRARSARRGCPPRFDDQIKDEDWSLVGHGINVSLAAAAVELRQALSAGSAAPAAPASAITRRPRSARRSPIKKHGRLTVDDPGRRRSDVRAGRAVDRGASPDPDPLCDAQQPRLSSGVHAPPAHGEPAQRGIERADIGTTIDDPEHRLRDARQGHGRLWRRADHRSQGSRRRR